MKSYIPFNVKCWIREAAFADDYSVATPGLKGPLGLWRAAKESRDGERVGQLPAQTRTDACEGSGTRRAGILLANRLEDLREFPAGSNRVSLRLRLGKVVAEVLQDTDLVLKHLHLAADDLCGA